MICLHEVPDAQHGLLNDLYNVHIFFFFFIREGSDS